MKSINWKVENDQDGTVEEGSINYNFSLDGSIEVISKSGKIPGKAVERFINAYLSGRKIQDLILYPIGYDK